MCVRLDREQDPPSPYGLVAFDRNGRVPAITGELAVDRALAVAGGNSWASPFRWARQTWRSAYDRRPPGRGERVRIFPGDLTAA